LLLSLGRRQRATMRLMVIGGGERWAQVSRCAEKEEVDERVKEMEGKMREQRWRRRGRWHNSAMWKT
jgi:hypothetical protein